MVEPTKKQLVKELDKLVSSIVRKRDTHCVTCGKYLEYDKRQAGHFIPRVVQKTRWDLKNVNVQCQECNVGLGGNLENYKHFIATHYGDKTLLYFMEVIKCYDNGLLRELSYDELIEELNKLEEMEKCRTIS